MIVQNDLKCSSQCIKAVNTASRVLGVNEVEDLKLFVNSLYVKPNVIAVTEVKSKLKNVKLNCLNLTCLVITLSVMIWTQNLIQEELLFILIINLVIVLLNVQLDSKKSW